MLTLWEMTVCLTPSCHHTKRGHFTVRVCFSTAKRGWRIVWDSKTCPDHVSSSQFSLDLFLIVTVNVSLPLHPTILLTVKQTIILLIPIILQWLGVLFPLQSITVLSSSKQERAKDKLFQCDSRSLVEMQSQKLLASLLLFLHHFSGCFLLYFLFLLWARAFFF